MTKLARWPLLLAALATCAGALGVDLAAGHAAPSIVAVLLALSAVCLGAFVYAEGARHRDWHDEHRGPDPQRQDS